MSNARKPRTPTKTARPEPPYRVPTPDSLAFGELFRIHAATGVDVLDPVTRAHAIAACLWYAARSWESPLTWEECQTFDLDDVELTPVDEELDEEEPDPTESGGPGTPSSESE